ncbi:MAG: RNA methyltransferase [Bacteroidales bacterium]|nr:RNA methyltransferase [Bacteroidales bacterium]
MADRKLLDSELRRLSVEEYRTRPESGLALVLDNVRSAYNVGSAFRTADAFGVDKLWLCGICAAPPSVEIHKTALGAENSVSWEHVDDTLELVARLKCAGYTVISVEQTENSVCLSDFRREPGRKYALIFGNEVDGVRQDVVDESDFALEIPQQGTKHSLNVSVCVGAVLWEFVR